MEPVLISGGRYADCRGTLRFANDFDLTAVKRFYTISNSTEEPRRGWVMHLRETKWFFPLRGTTKLMVEGSDVHEYLLESENPAVLMVPPGNWFLVEQDGSAEVQVFSNCRLGEFKDDDFRRSI